jgi:DNA topoisomerase-1
MSESGAANPRPISANRLAKKIGLKVVKTEELAIARKRHGAGFSYFRPDGARVVDAKMLRRFRRLAVPPAYENVLFAEDDRAHIQAIGRDAAGRLQYRYHPEWEKVREHQKAQRLGALVDVLPRIRRAVTQVLADPKPSREFALAAVIELIAGSALRPGSEEYAKKHGTRGAATLLKSNVRVSGDAVTLVFRGKGGKDIRKEFTAPRLCAAIATLRNLPGSRLFQYRDDSGNIRHVSARDVNVYLKEVAGCDVLLKDFRTLCASAAVLENLARTVPADSERKRRKQVLDAVRAAAEELANTPAVCRRSYVHETVLTAFEEGTLENFSDTLKSCRSSARRERFLAQVVATASV